MLTKLIGKVLGTKTDRDLKALQPFVEQVKQVYPEIQGLDDEGLRKKTASFRDRLRTINKEDQDRLNDIQTQLETEESLEVREGLYAQIESLDKSIYERSEKELELIRPEAFAVVKETARRWSENGQLEVNASEIDAALEGKDFLEIKGGKAIWKSSWSAAGNPISWDMVHYDVQLIG
jgi:preprotein translocase subunit SecA